MLFYEELKSEPIFMGFKVKADPSGDRNNDRKQPVGVDTKLGVAYEDLDSRLGTFEQAQALNVPYIGLSLMRPIILDGYQLICIDGDWKRAPNQAPKPEQTKLLDCLSRMGAAYEKSYSGFGYHFFVKVKADQPIPKTVDLGDECKIEIFSGIQSQRANILLTNDEAFGKLIEVDLCALFDELGIQTVSAAPLALRPIDSDKAFDQDIAKAMFNDTDFEILASAMAALPVPKDYHEWYTVVGLALKSVKGAAQGKYDEQLYDLWEDYSQRDPKYNARATLEKWNLKESHIRSSTGTIFFLAKQNGWIRPAPVRKQNPKEFERDKRGKIEPTQMNLLLHLEQYQFCFDEFLAARMGVFDGVMRAIDDNDIARIQLDAERIGFKRLPTQFVRENVDFDCSRNSFDSAIDWGKSLVWDGVPRCENLLITHFGAKDNEYHRAASLYITSAMGGRLMFPGCKADAAVILIGKQGAGKSTAISALAPMEETFTEINLSMRDADLSRQLRGKLIGELSELRGLNSYKDSEDIKSFMSRTFDSWIPKYKEFETMFKRRITFWGSTNEPEFLSDHTGNRRWLPIEVGTPDADLVLRDRDQIWSEAIHIYNTRGVCWKDVQDLVPEVHKDHTFVDPMMEELQTWILAQTDASKLTTRAFWGAVKYPLIMEARHSKAVGRCFNALGYKSKTTSVNGVSTKIYVKE